MEIILRLKVNFLLFIFVLTLFLPNLSTCCSSKHEDIKSITTVSNYETTKNTPTDHKETHVDLTKISTSKTIEPDKITTRYSVTTSKTSQTISELGSAASTDSASRSQSTVSHDLTKKPESQDSTKATNRKSEASAGTITPAMEESTPKNNSIRIKYIVDSGKHNLRI